MRRSTAIAASREALWSWHAAPGAFERLTPPWERVEVLERSGPLAAGSTVTLRISRGPLRLVWRLKHPMVEPGRGFRDVQLAGPFTSWQHDHRFDDHEVGSLLTDAIAAELPGGALGKAIAGKYLRRQLDQLLAYRHDITRGDLEQFHAEPMTPMRIAITGATGLIGSALTPYLTAQGHTLIPVSRHPIAGGIRWDPARGELDAPALEGLDAVIHLAGENLAGARWSPHRKRALLDSRTTPTSLLATRLAALRQPPRVLISASAVGYYGDAGDARLTEEAPAGSDFLGTLAAAWEDAAAPARTAGIRVVHPRFGVVLSPRGGALAKLLLPFRLGLGGPLGSGSQWLSWIGIDDLLGVLHHLLHSAAIEGPVNTATPFPVTNADFTRTLARVLRRPAILPVPAPALRLALGEMADATLLASQRVVPGVLTDSSYRWRHGDLEGALRHLLGRRAP